MGVMPDLPLATVASLLKMGDGFYLTFAWPKTDVPNVVLKCHPLFPTKIDFKYCSEQI